MKYTMYICRNDSWYVFRTFPSKESLAYYCSCYPEQIISRVSMNGHDLIAYHRDITANDGKIILEKHYYLRDFIVLDEKDRIIDPRPLISDNAPKDLGWFSDAWQMRIRKKHVYHRKSGKSSWGSRRLKHYKKDLKDQAFEKFENEGWNIRPKHHTPNAWDLEPARRNSACWKDQTKRKHQYKAKAAGIADGSSSLIQVLISMIQQDLLSDSERRSLLLSHIMLSI